MRTIHMCVSVRGMLHWSDAETKRNLKSITKSDGSRFISVAEFRNELMDELARGHEKLPLHNPPCEGFDYKTGCPGHDAPPESIIDTALRIAEKHGIGGKA